MRAAGYVRVSTEEQAERGLSLGEQRRRIADHAAERGWELVAVFEDAGFSGARADRPGLVRALAERDTYDVLVMWALDRLGRDLALLASTVGKLQESGVRIEVLSGPLELDTPEGQLHFGVRAAVSQYERQMIARRGQMAAEAIAQQGRYNGPPPSGYRFEGGLLVPDPAGVELVLRIFTEHVSGVSLSEIARRLNRERIPTAKGGRWRVGTLSTLIANPVYIGKVRFRGELREGVHEPIVPIELWERAQALRASRTSRRSMGRGRPPRGHHLFVGGMLRCAECGESMAPRTRRGYRNPEIYMCCGYQVTGCKMPAIAREAIDTAVYSYFEQVGLDVAATSDALSESRNRKLAEVRALLSQAEPEAQRARERLARVRRDYQDGRLDADDCASNAESSRERGRRRRPR